MIAFRSRLTALVAATLVATAPIALAVSFTAFWMAAICARISLVARAVWLASSLTSLATTAKPRPDSPARAASMVALSASSEVWPAIDWISLITTSICWAASNRLCTVRSAWRKLVGRPFGRIARRFDMIARTQHDLAHLARRIRDLGGIDRGGLRRLRGACDPIRHVAIARGEIGGGHANAFAGPREGRHHVVDRGLETPRDELPPGLAQMRFGDTAVAIDRDIVGPAERRTHRLRRLAEPLHAAVTDRYRADLQSGRRALCAPARRSAASAGIPQTIRGSARRVPPRPARRSSRSVACRPIAATAIRKAGIASQNAGFNVASGNLCVMTSFRIDVRRSSMQRTSHGSRCESVSATLRWRTNLSQRPLRFWARDSPHVTVN